MGEDFLFELYLRLLEESDNELEITMADGSRVEIKITESRRLYLVEDEEESA